MDRERISEQTQKERKEFSYRFRLQCEWQG